MKILIILFFVLFLFPLCQAVCGEGQININSASAEELDEIVYIGPSRAEQIIGLRPFDSVDDLIKVSGIGEVYLSAIKEQGLACVEDDEEKSNNDEDDEPQDDSKLIDSPIEVDRLEDVDDESIQEDEQENIGLETIKLNTKNIKSNDDKKNLNKSSYAKYGFVIFCVLLGLLFIFKKKRFKKNEFN